MAYAFNDDKGKYDLDENVLGGATNTLYDAELAIAENATDIADIQDSLSDSGWNNIFNGNIGHYRIFNGFCTLICNSTNITIDSNGVTLGILPQGARPDYEVVASATTKGASTGGQVNVYPDGHVAVYSFGSSSKYLGFCVTFPCA